MKLSQLLYERDDFDPTSTTPWTHTNEIEWCKSQLSALEVQEKRLRQALDRTEGMLTDADDEWTDMDKAWDHIHRIDILPSHINPPFSIWVPSEDQHPAYTNAVTKIVRNLNRTIKTYTRIKNQLIMATNHKKEFK